MAEGAGSHREPYAKLVYLLRRKPRLTLREFQEHWSGRHSDFGRRNDAVLRYVQYHALEEDPIREAMAQAAEAGVPAYDGLAIAWFRDVESLREAMGSDDVAAALEDEAHFIDHSQSVAMITDEYVVVEPQGPAPIVLVECLRRRPDIDRATFSERWHRHAHLGVQAHATGLLSGYIQNHTLATDDARVKEIEGLGGEADGWDGVVTAYFQSVAMCKELLANPLASETSFEDERTFMDHARCAYFLARRHLVKDLVR